MQAVLRLQKTGLGQAPLASGAILAVMMPPAVASAYANAGPGRGDMRTDTNAAIAGIRACADRTDMRARIGAVAADTGACANNLTGMATGTDTVIIDAGAGANGTDVRAGTDTMAPDMRANAHAKNTDAPAHIGNGRGRSEQDEREE
jgi:hypothetical protein